MYLADSNVLLDIIKAQQPFNVWSATALENALLQGPVFVNQIIYAEVSIAYASPGELDKVLARLSIGRHDLSWSAAHLAGQAFMQYRRQGGQKTAPLPDFYIGADAQMSGFTLITRDARRYRAYFPALTLVTMD